MKRLLSVLLIVVTVLSLFTALNINSSADLVPSNYLQLNSGKSVSTQITYENQKSYLKINLPSAGEVSFTITNANNHSQNVTAYIKLYDELFSREYLDRSVESIGVPNTLKINKYLYSGIYFLEISSEETPDYYYNVSVKANHTAADANVTSDIENPSGAILVQDNKEYTGMISEDTHFCYYKFVVPASAKVILTVYQKAPLVFCYMKYNAQDELSRDQIDSPGGTINIDLTAGTYFLRFGGNGLFYTTEPCLFNFKLTFKINVKTPTGIRCSSRATTAEKVSWNKASGASGYQVQISNNTGNKWDKWFLTSSNSYTFKSLTAGGKYKFRVRAYKTYNGKKYFSAWSSTLVSPAKPATVKIKAVTSPKKGLIKTNWAKAGGMCTGYQILYGRNKSFTSIAASKKLAGQSNTAYTGKNFTKGRTYYVKVRTYMTYGGKYYYGAWSATKAVKSK